MSYLDALRLAQVDGNDGMVPVLTQARLPAIQGDYAALYRRRRGVRRVGRYLRPSHGQQPVAHHDFLRDGGQLNHGWITGADYLGDSEVDRFVSERYLGVRINQRSAASIDEPAGFVRGPHAADKSTAPGLQDDARLLGGHDAWRIDQAVGLDDQGACQKRFDDRRRNARNCHLRSRFGAHFWT